MMVSNRIWFLLTQDETIALKKISSKVSRDVRKFWLKINKVVAFKQKIDADEVRQKVPSQLTTVPDLICKFNHF